MISWLSMKYTNFSMKYCGNLWIKKYGEISTTKLRELVMKFENDKKWPNHIMKHLKEMKKYDKRA